MTTTDQKPEAFARGARMLRTALGSTITHLLEDPAVVEIMLNPDGRLWVDRLSERLADTGERLSAADGERIVRLKASVRTMFASPQTRTRYAGFSPNKRTRPNTSHGMLRSNGTKPCMARTATSCIPGLVFH